MAANVNPLTVETVVRTGQQIMQVAHIFTSVSGGGLSDSNNAEIQKLQEELINVFAVIGEQFRDATKEAKSVAQSGYSVAEYYVDTLEGIKSGDLNADDVKELLSEVILKVQELLQRAQSMHDCFNEMATSTEQFQVRVEEAFTGASATIENKTKEVEFGTKFSKRFGYLSIAAAAAVPFLGPVAAPLVAAVAVGSSINSVAGSVMTKKAHNSITELADFAIFLRQLEGAAEIAKELTSDQLKYWRDTLAVLKTLKERSEVANPRTNNANLVMIIARWKKVAEQYKICTNETAEADRVVGEHIRLLT